MSEQTAKVTDSDPEVLVLGGLMRANAELSEVVPILDGPNDFTTFANQKLYEAILDLENRRKGFDPVSVREWALTRNLSEEMTVAWLGSVYLNGSIPGKVGHYAEIVRDRSMLRQLRDAARETLDAAENPTDTTESLVEQAEQRFFKLATKRQRRQAKPIADLVRDANKRLEIRQENKVRPGIPMGWPRLDKLITLRPSEVTIVAARTSVGKTIFAGNLAYHAACGGSVVLFSSLEMAAEELTDRLICMASNTPSVPFQIGRLSGEQILDVGAAANEIMDVKLWVNDDPDQSMMQIGSEARRLKSRSNLDLLIIDYLQIVRPDVRRRDRREEVDEISRRLKIVAKELQIPVVALAQVSREGAKSGEEPELHHLRESGALEQDADNVIFLHKPAPIDNADEDLMVVRVAKQRNGPKAKVNFKHIKPTFKLYEVEN